MAVNVSWRAGQTDIRALVTAGRAVWLKAPVVGRVVQRSIVTGIVQSGARKGFGQELADAGGGGRPAFGAGLDHGPLIALPDPKAGHW